MKAISTVGVAVATLLGACRTAPVAQQAVVATDVAPAHLLGAFVDDYNNGFRISHTLWEQLPHGRFHIVEWNTKQQYFVARNDAANSADAGLWSRIDWMPLPNTAPYTWAFCMTAYRAPTRDSARNTVAPNRAVPRTGCNGYPFSRMRQP